MKRFIRNVIIFIIIFAVLFVYAQNVLHYRWTDDTYSKMLDYKEQMPDSIDVAVFGTSEIHQAYLPIVTYDSEGMTGFNFAIANRSAITTYYQFEYMIKYQKPKLVVCDFACLFDNALPSESETVFRRVVDTMPDAKIRLDLIREICRIDPSQQFMSWMFPVFRYHTMWKEITAEEFKWDTREAFYYNNIYLKGAWLENKSFEGDVIEVTPELWQTDRKPDQIQDFSIEYYDRIIEECRKNGIAVVGMWTPKLSDAAVYQSNIPEVQAYLEERDIPFLNYNTYEQVQRIGLSQPEDYADPAHLNGKGAIKFSKVVAADLKELFPSLPDRRTDERVSKAWNADLEVFRKTLED